MVKASLDHGARELSLFSIVAVTVLAFLVPVVLGRLKRIRIPVAVGEILVGVIVGKSGLNVITVDPVLELLSFLGLAAIMFVSGLEIDFGLFRAGGPPPPRRARSYQPGVIAAVVLALSFAGAWAYAGRLEAQGLVQSGLLTALVIATVGLSLIVPVLKERNLLGEPLGRFLIVAGVLGDFLPILGLAVLLPVFTPGGDPATVLWVSGLVLVAAVAYRLAKATRPFWALREFLHGTAQLGVRGAFALMLVFLVLAEAIGVEAVLGTFLAGMLVSLLAGGAREEMVHKLDVLGFGFLTPFFFITVGVQFDLPALLADPAALALVPVLLLVTIGVKLIPGLVLLIWYPARQALAGAVLLGTQMSVTIAAASLLARAGVVTPAVGQAFILVAMVTAIVCPIVFGRILPAPAESEGPRPVIFTGTSRAAVLLAQRLGARGWPVRIVTPKPEAAAEFASVEADIVVADPTTAAGLQQAGAETAEAVVSASGDSAQNMQVARLARETLGVGRAIAFVTDAEVAAAARDYDIEVVNPDLAAIDLVDSLLTNPGAAALVTGNHQVQAATVVLRNRRYAGPPLRQLGLPASLLLVSVLRQGEKLIPHGDTALQLGDRLTLVGPPDDVEVWQRLLAETVL